MQYDAGRQPLRARTSDGSCGAVGVLGYAANLHVVLPAGGRRWRFGGGRGSARWESGGGHAGAAGRNRRRDIAEQRLPSNVCRATIAEQRLPSNDFQATSAERRVPSDERYELQRGEEIRMIGDSPSNYLSTLTPSPTPQAHPLPNGCCQRPTTSPRGTTPTLRRSNLAAQRPLPRPPSRTPSTCPPPGRK